MIASSQISLFQDSSRQVSAFDSSQLRIRQSAAPEPQGQTNRGTEVSLIRQAAYRYSSQEQMAFSSTSEVTGANRAATFTSSELVEKSSELFLMGQQALMVSRAALGVKQPRNRRRVCRFLPVAICSTPKAKPAASRRLAVLPSTMVKPSTLPCRSGSPSRVAMNIPS